jgi:hypothetical protein
VPGFDPPRHCSRTATGRQPIKCCLVSEQRSCATGGPTPSDSSGVRRLLRTGSRVDAPEMPEAVSVWMRPCFTNPDAAARRKLRDIELSTPMRHRGSQQVAEIALIPAVRTKGCSTGPRHRGCCSADSAGRCGLGRSAVPGPWVRRRGTARPAAPRPHAAAPARRCGRRARRCRARYPHRPRTGPREGRCRHCGLLARSWS